MSNIKITHTIYLPEKQVETELNIEEFLTEDKLTYLNKRDSPLTWLHFSGIQDAETLEKILGPYHIHELVIEDILSDSQRTKAEIYPDYLFIVGRCFKYSVNNNLKYQQLFLIIFPTMVLSFEPKKHLNIEAIHKEFNIKEREPNEISASFLSYILLDYMISQSYPAINGLLDRIEKIDQKLFASHANLTLHKVHKMKQSCARMRSSLRKINDMLQQIMRWNHDLIDQYSKNYFRDLTDITNQMCDRLDYANEVIQSITGTYLNIQSNQLNLQMRLLTVVNIIFMPLTLLAGIYGMNFDYIPGLHHPYGYHILLSVMVMIVVTLLLLFKKNNWL